MTIISKNDLRSGIFYTVLSRYSGILISILIGSILARVLSPDEFGVVALLTVFVTFFGFLSDFGLGPAVIQNQFLSEKDIVSIFSFSIIIAIFLSIVFFFLGPIIAFFYDKSELIVVSKYLSIAVFFNSISVIPRSLLFKQLEFKNLNILNILIQFICGGVAVLLAISGYGYYSLIVQSILVGLFSFVTFYYFKPIRFTLYLDFISISKILKFSIFQFLFDFVNYFSRNLDNILIGKYMGINLLGYYEKSYRLMMMPVQNLTHVISPVLLPVLSKRSDNENVILNIYLRIVNSLSFIGFPISVFLFFAAPEIIYILYGSQWIESVPVFKILSLTVGFQVILSSTGSVFQAVNRTDLLFFSGFISSLFMVSAIFFGIFIGKSLESVAWGLLIAFIFNFFQAFYFLIQIALKSSYISFIFYFIKPISISIIYFLLLYFISFYCFESIFISLISKIFIGAIFFLLLYKFKFKIL